MRGAIRQAWSILRRCPGGALALAAEIVGLLFAAGCFYAAACVLLLLEPVR